MNMETQPAVRLIHKRSEPVPIPGSAKKIYYPEYELKLNCFDPNKCSPPNSWNSRLMIRLGNHDNNLCRRITE